MNQFKLSIDFNVQLSLIRNAQHFGAQHNLFIPRPNTEALKKSFRYRGAVTWNSLSAEAKQATTLNSFYSATVH